MDVEKDLFEKYVVKNDSEAVNQVACDIFNKLREPSSYVFYSWGVSKYKAIIYKDMPALQIRTNGFLHKGNVVVAYNEAHNLYNVYILKRNHDVKQAVEDISEDQLQKVIDGLVETKNDKSSDYHNKCQKWIIKDNLAKKGKLYY